MDYSLIPTGKNAPEEVVAESRLKVIELAKQANINVEEKALTRHDVFTADECFLTGSAAEIIPVTKCDARVIDSGKPGPVTRRLQQAYRQLVRDCLDQADHEFGVVLIERGFEVGGGDYRSMVGTVARMLQVAEMDDGRYALVTVGTRRIRINEWLPDEPYPRADVEDWPDSEWAESATTPTANVIAAAAARVRRINALAAELGGSPADATTGIADDTLLATYHLSALAPLGPADRQRLLAASGPAQRLTLLDEALDDVEALLQFRLANQMDDEDDNGVDGMGFDFDGP